MFRMVNLHRLPASARGLVPAGAITIAMLMLSVPAAIATPKGEFAVFAQCPLGTPGLTSCLVIRLESGELTLGKLKVPIVNPQAFQGGLSENETTGVETVLGAVNGETLTRTPQSIPAGTVQCKNPQDGSWWSDRRGRRERFDRGRHGWFEHRDHGLCKAIFENQQAGGLHITPELAGTPSSIVLNEAAGNSEEGTALSLPIKFKLENQLLGDECYIGSDTSPVVLELTDGTAGTLKGKRGPLTVNPEGNILIAPSVTFVNDTLIAPEATGCGHDGRLDQLINTKLGLPAPTGTNTAILNAVHEQSGHETVEAHS